MGFTSIGGRLFYKNAVLLIPEFELGHHLIGQTEIIGLQLDLIPARPDCERQLVVIQRNMVISVYVTIKTFPVREVNPIC